MEEAAAVRRAALEAVDDVDPARLFERIEQRVEAGSMAPGALTLLSAAAVDDAIGSEGIDDRAAGVQLIYEGLRLTRALAHESPWDTGESTGAWQAVPVTADRPDSDGKSRRAAAADVDVLVADILVARGFYLLARTEAADAAVSVVRSFGRDQTVRRETADPTLDHNLETDVLELAVVAGTTAAGGSAPVHLREFVTDLADAGTGLPPADAVLTEAVRDRLDGLVGTDASPTGEARTSADH
ncbi:hypothetical protein ACFR9U_03395 [Halorientalis brevis]|uniref:Uncharacterized protein n=1 Tax=Halorientalis brevis TaxID=1126241 RepID=A0ABD6C7I9_9EURY|nr:hypothetical protein [Halorientalis brevis]